MKHWLRPFLLLSAIACCCFSGCVTTLILSAIDTDISREPRFQDIVGHEVRTRRTLYLYKPDYSGTYPDLRTFYVLHGSRDEATREGPILVVPAGHPVRFTKVLSKRNMGGGREEMFGEITLRGITYPVVEELNLDDYPHGGRRVFLKTFEIKD